MTKTTTFRYSLFKTHYDITLDKTIDLAGLLNAIISEHEELEKFGSRIIRRACLCDDSRHELKKIQGSKIVYHVCFKIPVYSDERDDEDQLTFPDEPVCTIILKGHEKAEYVKKLVCEATDIPKKRQVLVHGKDLLNQSGAHDLNETRKVLKQIKKSGRLYLVTVHRVKGYQQYLTHNGPLVRRFGNNKAEFWKDILEGTPGLRPSIQQVTSDKCTRITLRTFHALRASFYGDSRYFHLYASPFTSENVQATRLYRVLRSDESENGLVAKNSLALHVSVGRHCSATVDSTPYISTFQRKVDAYEWIAWHFIRKPKAKVVRLAVINPAKVCGTLLLAEDYIEDNNKRACSNAKRTSEAVIKGFVPAEAYRVIEVSRESFQKYINCLHQIEAKTLTERSKKFKKRYRVI